MLVLWLLTQMPICSSLKSPVCAAGTNPLSVWRSGALKVEGEEAPQVLKCIDNCQVHHCTVPPDKQQVQRPLNKYKSCGGGAINNQELAHSILVTVVSHNGRRPPTAATRVPGHHRYWNLFVPRWGDCARYRPAVSTCDVWWGLVAPLIPRRTICYMFDFNAFDASPTPIINSTGKLYEVVVLLNWILQNMGIKTMFPSLITGIPLMWKDNDRPVTKFGFGVFFNMDCGGQINAGSTKNIHLHFQG